MVFYTNSGIEYRVEREVVPCILPDKEHVILHLRTLDLKQYRQFGYLLSKYETAEQAESIESWAIATMAETLK